MDLLEGSKTFISHRSLTESGGEMLEDVEVICDMGDSPVPMIISKLPCNFDSTSPPIPSKPPDTKSTIVPEFDYGYENKPVNGGSATYRSESTCNDSEPHEKSHCLDQCF